MLDKTHGIPEGVGTAPTTGHPMARSRFESEGDRAARPRLVLLCLPMATDGTSRGPDRSEGPTGSGSPAETPGRRMSPAPTARGGRPATWGASSGRGIGLRLSERSVDGETNHRRHSQGIRCCLSSPACRATAAMYRVVLSSAPAPRHPTRRRGHCSQRSLFAEAIVQGKRYPWPPRNKRRNDW